MENSTIIGIKELRQNLPKIGRAANKGRHYTVVRYAKPYFIIAPPVATRKPKYTFSDLMNLRFKSKDRNLSKHVDKIVYGI